MAVSREGGGVSGYSDGIRINEGMRSRSFNIQEHSTTVLEYDAEEGHGNHRQEEKPHKRSLSVGHVQQERKISLLKLLAMTCAAVAGAPYGFEDCIGAGGPLATLSGLALAPVVWSLPMALMTAELSCMMPENGGHVLWVDRAFGSWWSAQNSYWGLLQAVFEGGLYPVMFIDYISHALGREITPLLRLLIGVSVIAAMTIINIWGADSVGSASILFTIVGFSPFALMLLLGLPQIDTTLPLAATTSSPNWPLFVTVLLWNTSGYDSIGSFAGEVINPGANFPTALVSSVFFTLTLDAVILLVAVSVVSDYSLWQDGTFVQVANILGGKPLALLFTIGASVTVVAMICALLCTSSRMMYGMAQIGALPQVFSNTHPLYGTPYIAMLCMAAAMSVTTFLPFSALAQADMWFYSLSTILKFASLVQLRKSQADAPRPYKIPVNGLLLAVFSGMPIVCCLVLIVFADSQTHALGALGVAFGVVVHYLRSRFSSHQRHLQLTHIKHDAGD